MEAVLNEFADVCWIEHRDAEVLEGEFLLIRHAGTLRFMVLAAQDHHRPVGTGAREVAVLDSIARAVETCAFPVPVGDHPVYIRMRMLVQHLRTYQGRGRQFLILPREMTNAVALEGRVGFMQCQVVAAQRRARVTCDEGVDPQARAMVAAHLLDWQSDQRLDTTQKYPAFLKFVAVGQRRNHLGDRSPSRPTVLSHAIYHDRPNGATNLGSWRSRERMNRSPSRWTFGAPPLDVEMSLEAR